MNLRASIRVLGLVMLGALLSPAVSVRADQQKSKSDPAKKDPASGSTKTSPSKAKSKEPKPPLLGRTIDFVYDAKDVKIPSRAYMGRLYVHQSIVDKTKPLPIVVFIHGLNKALIKYRWMGGGEEGDVRRILSDLMDQGKIPQVLLAAPSSIQPDAVSQTASFPFFDFDNFMALTEKNLEGVATIDRSRVIVAGHSGAGCSPGGGIVSATKSTLVPFSILSIDTCMGVDLAKSLAAASASTNIIVTWETVSWDRNFTAFKKAFQDTASANPAGDGVLRELDELPALPSAHDATVAQTFAKYLPKLLP
jgi:hypothetical protein